jgi:RNA polymerase sigma-70 factor, ECF subfamily
MIPVVTRKFPCQIFIKFSFIIIEQQPHRSKKSMTVFQSPFFQSKTSLVRMESFARFYEQAHLNVFRYAMVLCAGNPAEAEDITAEAFLRAWEKRQQFSGSSSAALGWVITIARNLLIDRRRSENTHPSETLLDEGLPDSEAGIEALLISAEQLQGVLEALAHLSLRQRDIFTLRYVLGWRVKRIAAHLDLPENSISVELRRALLRLKTQLARSGANPERTA